MDIEWDEPPKTAKVNGKSAGRYADLAVVLEQNPGRWAKVPMLTGSRTESSAAALAQNIRRGKVKGFEVGRYETAHEGSIVWARYRVVEGEVESVEGESVPTSRAPASELAPKVRAWAKQSGIGMSEHGRIPGQIIDQYLKEHPEDRALVRVRAVD